MDNVISFEIVLPNATVTTASNTTNADLFWGLKGGFNNFGKSTFIVGYICAHKKCFVGIVTSAVVKAYPLDQVYGGELIFSGDALAQIPAAMEAYTAMQNSSSAITKGDVVLAYSAAPGSSPAAILQVFYNVDHSVVCPERLLADLLYAGRDPSG